jgi:hypothetical protein
MAMDWKEVVMLRSARRLAKILSVAQLIELYKGA